MIMDISILVFQENWNLDTLKRCEADYSVTHQSSEELCRQIAKSST